jgi:hypothetical protein
VNIDSGEYTVGFRQKIATSALNTGTTDSMELNGVRLSFTSWPQLKTRIN